MRENPWSKKQSMFGASVPKSVKKPRMKWRILPILWMAFKRTSTVIGMAFLISALVVGWTASSLIKEDSKPGLPGQMVLFMELDGNLADVPPDVSLIDPFAGQGISVRDFVDAIDRARDDVRVEGIIASMQQGGYAVAHLQEIRAAIKRFKESGKFAYVYSASYGEAGTLGSYYLASAFEEIWMQPMGLVGIMGMNAEMPYFRTVLDTIGIQPQFYQRKDYKSAFENFTHSEITPQNREMITKLLLDISATLVQDISKDRGMEEAEFRQLVEKGLFIDKEAKDVGLVDVLDYGDALIAKINEQVTGDPEDKDLPYIDFKNYVKGTRPVQNYGESMFAQKTGGKQHISAPSGKAVALVYASGAIMSSNPEGGDGVAAADEISEALKTAAQEDSIKVVVLRIDSPGGSPVASETILHAVEKVQEKGKKVIVSMGPTAASGGYWIAAYADRIFVLPTTITGSIGVIGGKFSARQLWQTIGVTWSKIIWGRNAAMWSMNTPFSDSEAERINAMLDHVYENFISRVARGRNMSVQDVDNIAGGRVWSGLRAVDLGLADEFGGLNEALDYAAQQIGAKDRKGVDVMILPRPLSPIEKFVMMLEGQVRAGEVMGAQVKVIQALSPMLRDAAIISNPQNHSVYSDIRVR